MQEDVAARSGSLMETVKSVWGRRKWLGIAVFAVPFVAAVSLIMFMPGVYRSTATVLVDRQQVPESMVKPTVTSALETRLHTISQEILSRSRLDAMIKQFDLYSDLRRRVASEEVIERMRKDVRLELRTTESKDNRPSATTAFPPAAAISPARNARLLLVSSQANPPSSQASFQNACMNLTDSIVSLLSSTALLPDRSTSAAPKPHIKGYAQAGASPNV